MEFPVGYAPRPLYAVSRKRLIGSLFLLLSLVAALLTACEPAAQSAARQNKTKLDTELHTASTGSGIPARRLAPIIAQENALAAGTSSGSSSAYQAAADGYTKLYDQVVALEKLTPDQVQAQASSDLSALQSSLAMTEHASSADVTSAARFFDPTVPVAQQRLATAHTAKDYFAVDGYILDQLAAVTQILPVYQQIQTLTTLTNTVSSSLDSGSGPTHVLQCATEGGEIAGFGIVPAQFWARQSDYPIAASSPIMVTSKIQPIPHYFSSWPSQALSMFKGAQTADDFTALSLQIQAQTETLTSDTDSAELARARIAATVARYQNDVNTYQAETQANNDYLKTHRAKIHDVPDYISVWNQTNSTESYSPPSDFFPNVPDFQIDTSYAKAAAQDAKALASAQTSSDFSTLVKMVQQQEQALSFALVKVKAFYDTNITLQALIDQGQSTTTNVTFLGAVYKTPNAYEYADDDLRYDKKDTVAIKDAQVRIAQAAYRERYVSPAEKAADYQAIEDEAQMFIHNLSAMITNLAQMPKDNAARQAWSMKAHQADLDLISYYGLQSTRVIVVSLREQKARLFSNGNLVVSGDGKPYAFDVTTGSPDKPSVPGIHCALPTLKGPPGGDIFKSSEPKDSPFYYPPTPVHYSFGYSLYGYFVHDGWWRDNTEMGYLTNLPHYDPEAFNGGSHGCINFHYSNGDMGKVFDFSSAGIPIIVY